MEKLIEQALQSFTKPNQCKLCDVKLTTPQVANDHYNSKKHKNSVAKFRESFKDNVNHMQKSTEQNKPQVITKKPQNKDVPEKFSSMEKIIEKTLQSYTKPNQCKLCEVKLTSAQVANDHYNSKRHQNSVVIFRESFSDNLNNEQNSMQQSKSQINLKKSTQESKPQIITKKPQNKEVLEKFSSMEKIIEQKLQSFTKPNQCKVCEVKLTTAQVANDHYNSKRHKNSVVIFRESFSDNVNNEQKSMQQTKPQIITKKPQSKDVPEKFSSMEKIEQKLQSFTKPNQCKLCEVKLTTAQVAKDHYNSKRHKNNVVMFRESFRDNVDGKQNPMQQSKPQIITKKAQTKDVLEKFSGMEKVKEKTLQSFTKPNQCKLCEVQLTTAQVAKDHYNSKRHKNSVVKFRKSIRDDVNKMQKSTQQSKPQSITGKPQNKDVPEKNEDLFCDVCCVSTTTKEQIWNHMKGLEHQNRLQERGLSKIDGPYSPFCNNLPQKLQELMRVDRCLVCKDTLPTVKRAIGHYASPKHDTTVAHWFKELRKTQKLEKMSSTSKNEKIKVADKNCLQTVQKQEKMPSTSKQEVIKVADKKLLQNGQHTQKHEPIPSTSKYEEIKAVDKKLLQIEQPEKPQTRCYLCNLSLVSNPSIKNRHIQGFPHKDLAKLKSDLIKEDVAEEFWSIEGTQLYCRLCDSTLTTSSELEKHLKDTFHSKAFYDWSISLRQQDTLDKDSRWYYCKHCDAYLDGTSDADFHYQTLPHKIKEPGVYCEICKVSSSTPELHQLHNTTSKHLEKVAKAEKKATNKDVTQKKLSLPPEKELPKQTFSTTKAIITNQSDETENSIKVEKEANKDVTQSKLAFPPEEELPEHTKQTTKACDNETDETENSIKVIVEVPNQSFHLPEETKNEREQVFKELDKLMQKLYYSKAVPHQVALDYLKQVNKDVDELMKTSDQRKPKYTYSQEQLLKLRTESTYRSVDSQLRFRINRSCLWNKEFNDCDLKASDCPTTVYDYYVANNFDNFMSFLEDYLQGSV